MIVSHKIITPFNKNNLFVINASVQQMPPKCSFSNKSPACLIKAFMVSSHTHKKVA